MTSPADDVEVSSPACSMHLVDDTFMGYATKDEVLAFLNQLLEAERAGARVTRATAEAAGDGPLAALMADIHRDEARWCAMLSGAIKALGGIPSPRTGAQIPPARRVAAGAP